MGFCGKGTAGPITVLIGVIPIDKDDRIVVIGWIGEVIGMLIGGLFAREVTDLGIDTLTILLIGNFVLIDPVVLQVDFVIWF